ncbi:hypothetical protein EMCRGX_G013625 [Ephydatia muelleri]
MLQVLMVHFEQVEVVLLHNPTSTLIFTILPQSSSSQSYLHPHLHNPTSTLIFTILPPPSSSQSYLHPHLHNPPSTLIFTILPPPSSSQSYLHPHLHNPTSILIFTIFLMDAPPHPPAPPPSASITFTNYTLESDNLHVEIAWAPPNTTYGAIIMYQIQVGTKLVQSTQGTSVQNYASENVQERNTNPLFISGAKRDYSRSIIINAPKVDEWEIPACNVILKNAIYVNVAIKMESPLGEEAISPEVEGSGSVIPDPTSPYTDLGEVEPVNLISFTYQIASGMATRTPLYMLTIHCDEELVMTSSLRGEGDGVGTIPMVLYLFWDNCSIM